MSRLFGCICNQPERLIRALEPVKAALRLSSGASRWGLAYVQGDDVLLSRSPRPVRGEFDFFGALGGLRADYLIGYAADDTELSGNANTQPYRYRRWFFAQDGLDGVSLEAAELPSFLRRNIHGQAPEEKLFHLFLAKLDRQAELDNPHLELGVICAALRETVARAGVGEDPLAVGNLIVSNSRSLVAVRGERPLFVRRFREIDDPRRPETEFKAVLVVDGAESPGEGFEELPPRSVLLVHRDIRAEITALTAT